MWAIMKMVQDLSIVTMKKKITAGCLRNWAKKIYSGCPQCFCS